MAPTWPMRRGAIETVGRSPHDGHSFAVDEGTKIAKTQLDRVRLYSGGIAGHGSEKLPREQWVGLSAAYSALRV